jgi:Ca-activated chloride channel family protein
MQTPDKLELLRKGFRTLAQNLRAQDRVAIVAYAGSAGLVLPSTAGDRQGEIFEALDRKAGHHLPVVLAGLEIFADDVADEIGG